MPYCPILYVKYIKVAKIVKNMKIRTFEKIKKLSIVLLFGDLQACARHHWKGNNVSFPTRYKALL